MNFIIKKEDLGAFVVCVSQMMNEIGFCGFTYEDDFKNAVNSGTTEFFVSEDDEISVAFGNLKKQITNIESVLPYINSVSPLIVSGINAPAFSIIIVVPLILSADTATPFLFKIIGKKEETIWLHFRIA